jgi:hypothetical protein
MMLYRTAAPFSLLLSIIAVASNAAPAEGAFKNSYGLEVGEYRGQCVFFLTDTGMTDVEVTEALKQNAYDTSRGLEVLLTKATPAKCGELGSIAARKAGFTAIRVRLATEKDRWKRP